MTGNIVKRNSAFEILRLLAVFYILLEHCLLACSLNTGNPLSLLDNISWFIEAFTVCAVNLFFLLTGYFMDQAGFRLSRIINIWGKTVIYSVSIYVLLSIVGFANFNVKNMVSSMLPFLTRQYWFIQVYIVLAFLSPFICRCLNDLTEKRFLLLIGILTVYFSLHQTFIPVAKTLDDTQGYGIIWAIVLFVIGNYIGKYGKLRIKKINGALFLTGYAIIAVGIYCTNVLIVYFDIAQGLNSRTNFYNYNSISVLLESIALFCFFVKLGEKGPSWSFINRLGKSSLGGYLIACHPVLIFALWTDVFAMERFLESPIIYIAAAIGLSILAVVVSAILDMIMDMLLERIGFNAFLKRMDESRIGRYMNSCNRNT